MGIEIKDLENNITRLIIRNGRGNPLSPALLEELDQSMGELLERPTPPSTLIIDADGSSIFSGGFALPIIASWPREDLHAFFDRFLSILGKILSIESFTITVLEGSAVAGGFILSLASDIRIVGEGKARFGLPEVDLGVSVPAGPCVLLESRTSPRFALDIASTGRLIDAQEALESGYARYKTAKPMDKAMEIATSIAKKPGNGTGKTRHYFNQRILENMNSADKRFMSDFLDTWFSPAGQACIQAQAKRLGSKK
ncbi:MAG: enoyl-CoA hydratase/isomerase family protein [Myxococcota bacterium]|nr:enoyl-CoA hydratase/isomerase family protein [Myxococcota bacterium]